MSQVSLNVGQSVPVTAAPQDDTGAVGTVNGAVTWSSSDVNVVKVVPGSDEFNVTVQSVGAGSATVTASAQAIPFGPLVSSSLPATVTGAAAPKPFTHFVFTVGTPTP